MKSEQEEAERVRRALLELMRWYAARVADAIIADRAKAVAPPLQQPRPKARGRRIAARE